MYDTCIIRVILGGRVVYRDETGDEPVTGPRAKRWMGGADCCIRRNQWMLQFVFYLVLSHLGCVSGLTFVLDSFIRHGDKVSIRIGQGVYYAR